MLKFIASQQAHMRDISPHIRLDSPVLAQSLAIQGRCLYLVGDSLRHIKH